MALFALDLENAFEDTIGAAGAGRARYEHWLEKLLPAVPRLINTPQREAGPVLSLPSETSDLAEIESIASKITASSDTLVVVGMGGSSLSGETLSFIRKPGGITLHFVDNVDPIAIAQLCEALDWKRTSFLIISKSGNTVETLAQMSVFLHRAKREGVAIAKHFTVITITNGNILHTIATANDIPVVAHDPKLGGRFSIMSSVGFIPAAAMGLDIRAIRAGAQRALDANSMAAPGDAARCAALHRALMEKNCRINVMMHYGNRMSGLANWYRQCWGESLGKCELATTPVRSRGSTDQHSQLQLYLDGPKDKFFTMMLVERTGLGDAIDYPELSDERLAFLKGKTMGDLMVAEQKGTMGTLVARGCPVRSFTLPVLDEETLGALLMHFSLEIMFAAELMGVDAFDQPAVEDSKILTLKYLTGK